MNAHHLRFVLRQYIEHRDPENLRLHAWASAAQWLALSTALSQIPLALPFSIPMLGENVGALFVIASLAYWALADIAVTVAVGALTVGWVTLPSRELFLWGPGHGWFGIVAPLAVVGVSKAVMHYGHVYHHERANFLKGDPPLRAAADSAHALVWGVFHFGLISMVRGGYDPTLTELLDARERSALARRPHVPWANWARLASAQATYVCAPQTIPELVDAVRQARAEGQRVRVVASGFSWSSVAAPDQTLIFCERLDRIEVDLSEPDRPAVWVEAGVTNRQLNRELARHGLCMPWNVVLETVRVAGIVSSGTHGTGKNTSTVGDLVDALEVIDATGTFRVLSDASVGPEIMRAVRMGLGLFGVIARVRLRVAPTHRVAQTDERIPVADVLDRLPELIRAHDSVELYWLAFNRDMWLRTIDRTDAPRTFAGHGFWFRTLNFLQNGWMLLSAPLVSRFAPHLTPTLCRLGMRFLPFRTRVLDLPESHHYHHWIEMMPATGCMEVGFKAEPDSPAIRAAWEATERLVAEYERRGLYPLNLTLNMRFIGSSTALLSPAYGEGMTCYIEIMWMGRPEGWREFSSELCREWLKVPGALPHFSKEFEHVEDVVPIMREHLGDRRRQFLDALEKTGIDPDRAFFNPVTRRVLLDDPGV